MKLLLRGIIEITPKLRSISDKFCSLVTLFQTLNSPSFSCLYFKEMYIELFYWNLFLEKLNFRVIACQCVSRLKQLQEVVSLSTCSSYVVFMSYVSARNFVD